MSTLTTHRDLAQGPSEGRSARPIDGPVHDFGRDALPALRWVVQPRSIGERDNPGGAEARLSGMLKLGPMTFYAELVEVGYSLDGRQEFVAEQDVDAAECERTCGPDIHRAIDAAAETFLWKGREYALVVLPYGR